MQFSIGQDRVQVNVASKALLFKTITRCLQQGQGFALATLNLDHLVKLRGNSAFVKAYQAQEIVVADGNPIVWLSRLAGRPVELIPGADLVVPVAELAAKVGVPVAMVGSTQETLERAATELSRVCPGLKVAKKIAPPMGFDPASADGDAILQDLGEIGAGVCFVAFGAPKQEIFAARGRAQAAQMGFLSIGAGLDFIAGQQQRAPRLVRALALEWLWRALSSPARLGPRYARCLAILPGETMRAWKMRKKR